MKALKGVAATVVMLGALAFAAPASATTFCVPGFFDGCTADGGNQALSTLQVALTANAADGQADTIKLAPGTYSQATTFVTSGSDPLTVKGAGRTQSVITNSGSSGTYVMNLFSNNSRDITVSDLSIVVPAAFPNSGNKGTALIQTDDVLERVDVVSKNRDASGIISITYGGTFRDVNFRGVAGGSFDYALGASTTSDFCSPADKDLIIQDVTIEKAQAGITADCPTVGIDVDDVRIKETNSPITVGDGATMHVTNALIESGDGVPIQASNIEEDGDTWLFLNHVTAIATGDETRPGLLAKVYDVGDTDNVRVDVTSSVFHGFAKPWAAEAPSGVTKGNTFLDIRFSNYPAPGTSSGDATVTVGEGNVNAAPAFAGPGDYHPAAGSSLIDAGEPSLGVTSTDLDGKPRPTDGNGDTFAISDAGAFEFQPPPPPATCETDPTLCPAPPDTTKPKVSKVKFSFKAGKGGSLRMNLSEDSTVKVVLKPTPKGKRKVKSFTRNAKAGALRIKLGKKQLKPGKYRLSIVATDAAGNRSNPVVRKVKIKQ